MSKKNTTEKVASPKKAIIKKPIVKLVSYSMRAMIRTGEYESIEPEITVEAQTIEAAHEFVFGYISKLHQDYSINVKRMVIQETPKNGQIKMEVQEPAKPQTTEESAPVKEKAPDQPAPIAPTSAYGKAKQAIDSCLTPEALNLIAEQIHKSVKLNDSEKSALLAMATYKTSEFNGKFN